MLLALTIMHWPFSDQSTVAYLLMVLPVKLMLTSPCVLGPTSVHLVLWRLCRVFGAVSGLLRAERVANEWPVRGNEVWSAGRLMASCSPPHCLSCIASPHSDDCRNLSFHYPGTALNTELSTCWTLRGKTRHGPIGETKWIIKAAVISDSYGSCSLRFFVISSWTMFSC